MTPQQAYDWLCANRETIAGNLRLQAMDAQGSRQLAERVTIMTDSPEIQEIIRLAAIHALSLEIEVRRWHY
jgi:hypothetical protein